ncbi:helix-turn-helix transcriptional regulator [bacterium]|nr:helix-turn-helix transcriptional regulator [bacterium]
MATFDSRMKLKDWRESAGLTQRELARLAVVARSAISHVETGRVRPTAAFAGRICRALSKHLGRPVATWDLFPECFKPLPNRATPLAGSF